MEITLLNKTNPINNGYEYRKRELRAIIIHTTNGKKGSSYEQEVSFLRNTPKVGAHFLVGKEGQITQFLNFYQYAAWHTGVTLNPYDSNQYTIGIENHYTPGELWTPAMWKALTELVLNLPKLPLKTHREIAFPPGRKQDPSGVTDTWFNSWKKNLALMSTYVTHVATLRNVPRIDGISKVSTLPKESVVFGYFIEGQDVRGSKVWLSTPDGYIHRSGLLL